MNTPTLRTTNIEFSDVASSGATLLSITSGLHQLASNILHTQTSTIIIYTR
ncbi:MAG: hypothetical protein ACKPKO_63940 [Candidatus Fonsibacter sp.]